MNPIDLSIIHYLNSFAQRSEVFDSVLLTMSDNALLQGGLIVVLYWWAWVPANKKSPKEKDLLLFGLVAGAFALLVARTLALGLPFRMRPIHNPMLDFKFPHSMDPNHLIGWSSFPSDHAVLFFCLAMSLWLVSRRLGALALVYALLGVCFPRVYLGLHYPTDILVGAALGIGIACLGTVDSIRNGVVQPMLYWQKHRPASFTAFLFLLTFEIAEQFTSVRSLYHGVTVIQQALR